VVEPDVAAAFLVLVQNVLTSSCRVAGNKRLSADRLPSPSGHDPGRNPHRQGIGWTKHTVRAILCNPRYTGYQVWNRQRRDEVLLDIDDVAAGYVGRMRWNHKDAWVFSEQPAHAPLVSKDDFDRVQALIGVRAWRHKPHTPTPIHRVYVLRKRLRCGLCQRRLQGHWVHAQPYYRCSFPPEYQAATGLAHSRTVYLREVDLLPHLDGWLAGLFDPDRLDDTLDALEQASHDQTATAQQLGAAEQAIVDCQRQLTQYRAALDAGSDPAVVTGWINEATATKATAEAERARLRATAPKPLSRNELRALSPRPAAWSQRLTTLTAHGARRCTTSWASRGSTSPLSGSWSSPRTWYANGWCRRGMHTHPHEQRRPRPARSRPVDHPTWLMSARPRSGRVHGQSNQRSKARHRPTGATLWTRESAAMGASESTTSLPSGNNASAAILKLAIPKGMPMIVRNRAMPLAMCATASQRPAMRNQMTLPIIAPAPAPGRRTTVRPNGHNA
jgi:hypothetical protein